jgi:glycosyltransferase involved in cell wall biosynthesis
MEHPKILFIHHGKGIGGAPLSLLYLVKAITKTRYRPSVAFLHNSDAMTLFRNERIHIRDLSIGRYDLPHTKIWWFRWYHIGYLMRAIWDSFITLFFTAPQLYKEEQPEIVHLNTSSLIAWGLAAKWRNIPVVWHIREPLADGYFGLRKALITQCISYAASNIIAISHHDAQPWATSTKMHVIYNAVPADRFDYRISPKAFIEQHNLKQAPRILFVGGHSKEKGTLAILHIFAKVLRTIPTAQLLIAGYLPHTHTNGFLRSMTPGACHTQAVITELKKLGNCVVLLGPINSMPQAMAAADVIVFPATVGHFARPIIEAGFMKKPVVASDLAPLNELVIDGKTGFLLRPYDYNAWADRLITLLTNPTLATSLSQAGFDYCTKTFSLPEQIIKIIQLYDDVIKRRNT